MIYKIIRFIPYVILLLLAVIFLVISVKITNDIYKNIFINLSASAFFVIIAYFFYDLIKKLIEKRESKYIDYYIRNLISNDVFVVLYTLKKYIHGYNLNTNTMEKIFDIVNYTKEQIKCSITNQSYIGFQIFKEMDEVKNLFKEAINNNFVIKYSQREYVINLLKIINILNKIEYIFRDETNFEEDAETAIEFIFLNGKQLNPENEDNRYLLLKKTQIENRAVVYDSGIFEKDSESKLLKRYIIKSNIAEEVSVGIYELNKLLIFWLPERYYISKYNKLYRIVKDYFSPVTNLFTKQNKIYVADIIETKNKCKAQDE
jgi:hypothetical protein